MFQEKLDNYLNILKMILLRNAQNHKGGAQMYKLTPGKYLAKF